jgi:TetR/AcrR family transcriptional regulator, transcriptional repressor for nem operon
MAKSKEIQSADILSAALKRLRGGGYESFSMRDLASDLGIKSASLHYYFPTKDDLCATAVEHAVTLWTSSILKISAEEDSRQGRLSRLLADDSLGQRDYQLLAVLGATTESLPPKTQAAVRTLIGNCYGWLYRSLREVDEAPAQANLDDISALTQGLLAAQIGAAVLQRSLDATVRPLVNEQLAAWVA